MNVKYDMLTLLIEDDVDDDVEHARLKHLFEYTTRPSRS